MVICKDCMYIPGVLRFGLNEMKPPPILGHIHRQTGPCGLLAIATWATWFWAAQGQLLTKKKEERKGKKKKERKKEKEKKRKKRREEREEDLRPVWAGYSVFRLCTSLHGP